MAVLLDGQPQAHAQMGVNVVCPRHYMAVYPMSAMDFQSENELHKPECLEPGSNTHIH